MKPIILPPPILAESITYYNEVAANITDEEKENLARLVLLEAGNQSSLGQRAVVEVVFNRVLSDEFPNTVNEVIFQKNQFTPAEYISITTPTQAQYKIIEIVLEEIYPALDQGVVFFSTTQYNDFLYEKIGDHYFCYSKTSYELKKGI